MKTKLLNFRIEDIDRENVEFLRENGFNVSHLIRKWIQMKVDAVRNESPEIIYKNYFRVNNVR